VIVVLAVFCSGILHDIAEGAGSVWSPLTLYFYGSVLAFELLVFWRYPALFGDTPIDTDLYRLGSYLAGLVTYFLVFIFISGLFLRAWSLQFGGFSPHGGDELAWTQYAVSWLLDNGLGNFGQIFGWDISPIHPINDTARSVVWIYNLGLEFLAVAAVVRAVGRVAQTRRQSPRQAASAPATDNQAVGE
jgi:hypothetical protein